MNIKESVSNLEVSKGWHGFRIESSSEPLLGGKSSRHTYKLIDKKKVKHMS